MKILNLYAGIGGNRKLWGGDDEITAVEIDPAIAKVYQDMFPKDKVIVADAHEYLLEHYKEYDFIWSSPPCPTHSDIRRCGVHKGQYKALYPDMTLYQEIILLTHFGKGKWVVENVIPYYEPLIPGMQIERHLFWTNFPVSDFNTGDDRIHSEIKGDSVVYGFDLKNYDVKEKRKLIRNMVNPHLGLHLLKESQREPKTLWN
jgi:DNA (cytosine-5)-methyltransferase 1